MKRTLSAATNDKETRPMKARREYPPLPSRWSHSGSCRGGYSVPAWDVTHNG
jgi:hypothetical protein